MGKSISKDADKLLCTLYKKYLECRKAGQIKDNARCFGDSDDIQREMFPKQYPEDIADTCRELHRKGYLLCTPGDDMANDVILTDVAIVYMENRFKNGLLEVIQFLSHFRP